MADSNSTARATADVIQLSNDHCLNMTAFFDLAEREIKDNNNTDWDGIQFLVQA